MSNIQLIQDFFGTVRKVSMDEFKALGSSERAELAQAIAAQRGLVAVNDGKGGVKWVPPSA